MKPLLPNRLAASLLCLALFLPSNIGELYAGSLRTQPQPAPFKWTSEALAVAAQSDHFPILGPGFIQRMRYFVPDEKLMVYAARLPLPEQEQSSFITTLHRIADYYLSVKQSPRTVLTRRAKTSITEGLGQATRHAWQLTRDENLADISKVGSGEISISHIVAGWQDVKARNDFIAHIAGYAEAFAWTCAQASTEQVLRGIVRISETTGADLVTATILFIELINQFNPNFYCHYRNRLRHFSAVPALPATAIIGTQAMEDRTSADWCVLAAYTVGGRACRIHGGDDEEHELLYPSGRSYWWKATADAERLAYDHYPVETIVAALLQHTEFDSVAELEFALNQALKIDLRGPKKHSGKSYIDHIPTAVNGHLDLNRVFGFMTAIRRLNAQPFHPHLPREANFVGINENDYELQLVHRIAEELHLPVHDVIGLTLADNYNWLSTRNGDDRRELLLEAFFARFVMAPFAERHLLFGIAKDLYRKAWRIADPEQYESARTRLDATTRLTAAQRREVNRYLLERLAIALHHHGITPKPLQSASYRGAPETNPFGQPKDVGSALEKELAKSPIEDQKDLIRLMYVAESVAELESIRHSIAEEMSTRHFPVTVIPGTVRVVGSPSDPGVGYQLCTIRFPHPEDPTFYLNGELQLMTADYYRIYRYGYGAAPYLLPHYATKIIRIGNQHASANKLGAKEGQQIDHVDPPLIGNAETDAYILANSIRHLVLVKVPLEPLEKSPPASMTREQINAIPMRVVRLPRFLPSTIGDETMPIGLDLATMKGLLGNKGEIPTLYRLTPDQKGSFTTEIVNVHDPIYPADILLYGPPSKPVGSINSIPGASPCTSVWAQRLVDAMHPRLPNVDLVTAGRYIIAKRLDNREAQRLLNDHFFTPSHHKLDVQFLSQDSFKTFEDNVIRAILPSLEIDSLDLFYSAIALGHWRGMGPAYRNFCELFDHYYRAQFVQFDIDAPEWRHGHVSLRVIPDENQSGYFAEIADRVVHMGYRLEHGEVRGSPESGVRESLLMFVPENPQLISQLENVETRNRVLSDLRNTLRGYLWRRRGQHMPATESRRFEINYQLLPTNESRGALLPFSTALARQGIDIESTRRITLEDNTEVQTSIVHVPLRSVTNTQQDLRLMLVQLLERLHQDQRIGDFTVRSAPISDETRAELLRILLEERQRLAHYYPEGTSIDREFPLQPEIPLPPGSGRLQIAGGVDWSFVSDFRKAITLLYQLYGYPDPSQHNPRGQVRRSENGGHPTVHSLASTYMLVRDMEERSALMILRKLLQDYLPDLAESTANTFVQSHMAAVADIERTGLGPLIDALAATFPYADAAALVQSGPQIAGGIRSLCAKAIQRASETAARRILAEQLPLYSFSLVPLIRDYRQSLDTEMFDPSEDAAWLADLSYKLDTTVNPVDAVFEGIYFGTALLKRPTAFIREQQAAQYYASRRRFLRSLDGALHRVAVLPLTNPTWTNSLPNLRDWYKRLGVFMDVIDPPLYEETMANPHQAQWLRQDALSEKTLERLRGYTNLLGQHLRDIELRQDRVAVPLSENAVHGLLGYLGNFIDLMDESLRHKRPAAWLNAVSAQNSHQEHENISAILNTWIDSLTTYPLAMLIQCWVAVATLCVGMERNRQEVTGLMHRISKTDKRGDDINPSDAALRFLSLSYWLRLLDPQDGQIVHVWEQWLESFTSWARPSVLMDAPIWITHEALGTVALAYEDERLLPKTFANSDQLLETIHYALTNDQTGIFAAEADHMVRFLEALAKNVHEFKTRPKLLEAV